MSVTLSSYILYSIFYILCIPCYYYQSMFFKRLGEFILDLLEVFVTSFAIFLFVYLLILQPHKIKGSSMEPNYHDGQYILTDKLSYRFKEPQRGDIVVFKPPVSEDD